MAATAGSHLAGDQDEARIEGGAEILFSEEGEVPSLKGGTRRMASDHPPSLWGMKCRTCDFA
jgi:hypothetical protein